jgi:ABC-type multidrug transport system ATPase subunit
MHATKRGLNTYTPLHRPTQTIREAFLFSARLRQPRETSDEEIESYVNKVIEILELEELADAIIGVPGAGLSIEQRRVRLFSKHC